MMIGSLLFFTMLTVGMCVVIRNANDTTWDTICEESPRNQRIEASMIVSDLSEPEAKEGHRRWQWVKTFKHDIFREKIKVTEWPAIFTGPCPNRPNNKEMIKSRGSNIAHMQVWDQFYRNRRNCASYHNDIMIIFEDDAYPAVESIADATIAAVQNMSADTDVLFLGYCLSKSEASEYGFPWESGRCPYCLHAYAITVSAAKKLLDLIDPCSPFFADAQFYIQSSIKHKLNFEVVPRKIDPDHDEYLKTFMYNNDLHLSGSFLYGGIFAQCKYYRLERVTEGTVAAVLGEGSQLYYMWHEKWVAIQSMGQFEILGLDLDDVVQMLPHQFHRFEINSNPIKDKIIAKILEERAGNRTSPITESK